MLTNFKKLLTTLHLSDRKVWITSDTHFNHALLITPRGFADIPTHDAGVIAAWNANVAPDDVVIHLGDFILQDGTGARTREILAQLNGTILLLWGNHPSGIKALYREALSAKGLADCEVYPLQIAPNAYAIGDILDGAAYGVPFVLCHFPITSWTDAGKGSVMLCGHSHGSLPASTHEAWVGGKIQDVGWDVFKRPLTLKEAIEVANIKPLVIVDHHGTLE